MVDATPQPKLWEHNVVHRLRELIAEAFSAAAIAETLATETGHAVTRDMVSSKVRALGLQCAGRAGRPRTAGETSSAANGYHPETIKRDSGHMWRAQLWPRYERPLPLPLDELRMGPRGYARAFADLEPGCCAWPVSDWLEEGTARSPFCCERVAPGRPYCRAHAAIAFLPARAA